MRVVQRYWTPSVGWDAALDANGAANLALVFGSRELLGNATLIAEMRRAFPDALFVGCSTAGEIHGTQVSDDSIVLTTVAFERTQLRGAYIRLAEAGDSAAVGRRLASALPHDGLRHVLVLSDGKDINGSELVEGLASGLPTGVAVTGGLAGDGDRFERTLVLFDQSLEGGSVAAVGVYGAVRIGYGSLGGWDPFGPERLITRSTGNVLFELDGQSALGLYRKYLGDQADDLPASGLLFPLSVRVGGREPSVVRTILGIDENTQSLVFAGDMPEGSYARLMKANFDRLIDGAVEAARVSRAPLGQAPSELALLVSCVGRKLVLKQRIEEEVEGVRDILGPEPVLAGFYSYGEISPFTPTARCELHNQTMTITTFTER